MALTDAIAALFGYRRIVVYDHMATVARVQGLTPNDLYRQQPALRAVVSFLADNVAGVPRKCYVREGDTDRPRDTKSDLARLLSRPSKGTTTYELVRGTTSDVLLWGSALWFRYPDEDAPSGWAIRLIPWAWVDGQRTEDGFEPSAYIVTNPYTGGCATLDAGDCVRFFAYDPRGTLGVSSPIEALKQVLSEQISAWEYRNGVWKNGGRVSQWISRPAGAEWSPGARDRFAKSWKARFAGKDGTDTGGTPLLEDGMRLESTTFNAREAQWQEATRLAREDVAGVYHVNPSMIWHSESQTYASAKANARALYADSLGNIFTMIQQRINLELVPALGLDPERNYCEFDLSSKLAASFEEQAGVLQSSVGGPFMLRNEARARMNLPALPGGDELIVPLNVTEGGLASPRDTDPTKGAPEMPEQLAKALADAIAVAAKQLAEEKSLPAKDVRVEPAGGDAAPFGDGGAKVSVTLLKTSSEPPEDSVAEIEATLTRAMERQARRVFADLRAGEPKARKAADEYPWWWDMLRWDRELGEDLEPLFRKLCDLRGMAAMSDIEEPASAWDSRRTENFVHAMAVRRAHLFNEGTMHQLAANMLEFDVGDPNAITAAERSFLDHAANRAVRGALTFATAVCGFATKEAVRQAYPRDTDTVRRTKTWRHHGSKSPRSSHAAMDGETVGLDERFSNGADYPGDLGLPAEETVNCHCTIDVGVEKNGNGGGSGGGDDRLPIGGDDDGHVRMLADGLYVGTPNDVRTQASQINAELADVWVTTPHIDKSVDIYRARYASLIEGLATNAPIHVEDFAVVKGHEAQLARWLSKAGIEVLLRDPNAHKDTDGNTSDALIGGVTFDFKRIDSDRVSRMVKDIVRKLGKQGPGFVIDLSLDKMSLSVASERCHRMLDDPQIVDFMFVSDGKLYGIKQKDEHL
ncbi:MAG: phage portal protein [Atopobiaceae bacterium]|nr:phage portal protein [Atopobiaceae bacterium]